MARSGKLPEPLAFKLAYDAYTLPQLYDMYCDDEPRKPGLGRFDLHPFQFADGRPVDYRSDRRGPAGKPRPAGSRFGPQNMVVCGWALQALKTYPTLWSEPQPLPHDKGRSLNRSTLHAWLELELGAGLRTWQTVFDEYGYIPTGIGAGSMGAGYSWEDYSDAGGYAHLLTAGAQWIFYLEGKRDWEQHRVPAVLK
ncbi:MAG: hypothetical protein QM775_33695 [Pirellulales bacterium]